MKRLFVVASFAIVAVCAAFVSYTANAKNKAAELNLLMGNIESLSSDDVSLFEACDFYCQYNREYICELITNIGFSIFCDEKTLRR